MKKGIEGYCRARLSKEKRRPRDIMKQGFQSEQGDRGVLWNGTFKVKKGIEKYYGA